jgi:hypothetical protein
MKKQPISAFFPSPIPMRRIKKRCNGHQTVDSFESKDHFLRRIAFIDEALNRVRARSPHTILTPWGSQ